MKKTSERKKYYKNYYSKQIEEYPKIQSTAYRVHKPQCMSVIFLPTNFSMNKNPSNLWGNSLNWEFCQQKSLSGKTQKDS